MQTFWWRKIVLGIFSIIAANSSVIPPGKKQTNFWRVQVLLFCTVSYKSGHDIWSYNKHILKTFYILNEEGTDNCTCDKFRKFLFIYYIDVAPRAVRTDILYFSVYIQRIFSAHTLAHFINKWRRLSEAFSTKPPQIDDKMYVLSLTVQYRWRNIN